MNYGVTGTSGYLGGRVVDYVQTLGHTVYSFSRKHSDDDNNLQYHYSLEKGIRKEILSKLDVLIHCAYDFTLLEWDDIMRVNVDGTKILFDDAFEVGVKKLIYISTMSSYETCKSNYGKAKYLVEKHIWKYKPVVIKPGLIYGDNSRGMIGMLQKVISSFPIVPVVGGSKILYLINERDLCELICRLSVIEGNEAVEIIAANKNGKTFREILKLLAYHVHKKRIFIPIPYNVVYGLLTGAEGLKIKIGFRSDSLVSLYTQNENPDFSSLEKLKYYPSDFVRDR